jgi:hypothetical protein
MYILYLEKQFGTEINFYFGRAQQLVALKDGSQLMGLTKLVVPNGSICPGWGNVTITPAAAPAVTA